MKVIDLRDGNERVSLTEIANIFFDKVNQQVYLTTETGYRIIFDQGDMKVLKEQGVIIIK